ncbi:SDR family oxidoreductase [Thermopolyspora sp. NPDC052614]|uniref:SDR family NAD(P)-dependent oxidoreductase n=1 Tax=Thermopolyspora sp. NPDC052614 TaxID=3155682 RepID=UPI0034459426
MNPGTSPESTSSSMAGCPSNGDQLHRKPTSREPFMSADRFQNKAVIVSGSASGIGRASAVAFAREGARVACLDIDPAGGEETVAIIRAAGGSAAFFPVDVRDAESVRTATEQAVDYLGELHITHNNAGANGYATIHEMPVEDWDHIFAVNTRGVFLSMKYQIPHLLDRGGSIVLTGSIIQHGSRPRTAAYSASKLALNGLARAATLDYGTRGIRVNVVNPGTIDTPMVRKAFDAVNDEARFAEMRDEWVRTHMAGMRRMGTPEEVAAAVLMLSADDASFISGATIVVDGGATSALI